MTKIVFNTRRKDAPASSSYAKAFSYNSQISFNDYDNFEKYDHALFMTYKEDLDDLKSAKINNPHLKCGLIDPRGSEILSYVKYIDYFVVDSIEMYDYFLRFDKPIFKYLEYPDFRNIRKIHKDKDKIIVGYHGNKVHLAAMYPKLTTALEYLAEDYQVEFWAVYNVKTLGVLKFGLPKNVKIRHIQWYPEVYEEVLSEVDIGIAPSSMPMKRHTKMKSAVSKFFLDNKDDYIIKFKMPSNAGRAVVFQKLGIPVVADFLPSFFELIEQGKTGLFAYSTAGWYRALHQLASSAEYRNIIARNAEENIEKKYNFEIQNQKFIEFYEDFNLPKETGRVLVHRRNKLSDFMLNYLYFFDRLFKKWGELLNGRGK